MDGQRTIHAALPDTSLDDGGDDPDDAVRRRCDGGLAGRLPSAVFDSSPAGDCDPGFGHNSLRESEAQPAARVHGDYATRGANRGSRFRNADVRDDVCDAADRMGNAVGGALSDRALRPNPSASYPAAQSDALRGPAEDAYYRRILVLRDIHCAFRRGPIPYPDLARRPDRQDGALEGPWTRNRKLGLNSRLLIGCQRFSLRADK